MKTKKDNFFTAREIVALIKNGEYKLYPTEADVKLIEEYADQQSEQQGGFATGVWFWINWRAVILKY